MPVEIKTMQHPDGNKVSIMATFDQSQMLMSEAVDFLFGEVIRQVAAKYVEEHYPELVAKINQDAIATLAVAEAGKQVAKAITERPVVHTEHHTEVYQRGILGGLRRIR